MKTEFNWYGNAWKDLIERIGNTAMHAVGLQIEGVAKDYAPRKSGRLVGSITTRSDNAESKIQSPAESGDVVLKEKGYTVVGTNVEYASWIEYGTYRMYPQAYLRPAIDTVRGDALSIVERSGKKEFEKYADRPKRSD